MPFPIHKNKKKVAICGTGSGWELLPIQSDHTVYCLNDFVNFDKFRVQPDVLFIMDILDEKPQVISGGTHLGQVVKQINDLNCLFIAPFKYAEIPNSRAFPIKEVVARFGIPYFTNTIAYMVAFALLQGAEEIEFFGVNQAGAHEYAEEKGGVEYWIGVAIGSGVKVTINGKNSQLLRFKGRYGNEILYGYLQDYASIIRAEKKFGEAVIRQLFTPSEPFARVSRKVNDLKNPL